MRVTSSLLSADLQASAATPSAASGSVTVASLARFRVHSQAGGHRMPWHRARPRSAANPDIQQGCVRVAVTASGQLHRDLRASSRCACAAAAAVAAVAVSDAAVAETCIWMQQRGAAAAPSLSAGQARCNAAPAEATQQLQPLADAPSDVHANAAQWCMPGNPLA